MVFRILGLALLSIGALAAWVDPKALDACPGYEATNVKTVGAMLTADLTLDGPACNIFGNDIQNLSLSVVYETGEHLTCVTSTKGQPIAAARGLIEMSGCGGNYDVVFLTCMLSSVQKHAST